jgi:hypothetical protein
MSGQCRFVAVRPEGANHQWRKNPPRELSIDLEADERLGRVTGWAGASRQVTNASFAALHESGLGPFRPFAATAKNVRYRG